jgi:hypothetical protein
MAEISMCLSRSCSLPEVWHQRPATRSLKRLISTNCSTFHQSCRSGSKMLTDLESRGGGLYLAPLSTVHGGNELKVIGGLGMRLRRGISCLVLKKDALVEDPPRCSNLGDMIWYISGSDVPLAVQKSSSSILNQRQYYQLLEEAYLYVVVQGEALNGKDPIWETSPNVAAEQCIVEHQAFKLG